MQNFKHLAIAALCASSCPKHWDSMDNHGCGCRGVLLGDFEHEGYCWPTGYVPGGGPIIIEDFDAPQVKLQQNAIANIAKDVGFATDVGSDLASIAAACKEIAKNVEILAGSLGIFGSVFSMFSPKPSVDDILGAVDEAFKQLTKKVNDQFTNMKGYVDQQILESSKDRWEDSYAGYYNEFKGCLRFDPQGWNDTIKCMENVDNAAGSNKAIFMDFLNDMDNDDFEPSVNDIKKMEVQFNVYNNYAQLRMMMLLSLYGAFKDDDAMPSDWVQLDAYRAMAKSYLQTLRDESLMYKKYNQFCRDKITAKYNEFEWDHFEWNTKCGSVEDKCVKSPIIKRNTYYEIECWSFFDYVAVLPSQTCNRRLRIAAMGQDDQWTTAICTDTYYCGGTKAEFGERAYIAVTTDMFKAYHSNLTDQVKYYWEATALAELDTYQQIHDEAVKRLEDYADVNAHHCGINTDLVEPSVEKINKVEL